MGEMRAVMLLTFTLYLWRARGLGAVAAAQLGRGSYVPGAMSGGSSRFASSDRLLLEANDAKPAQTGEGVCEKWVKNQINRTNGAHPSWKWASSGRRGEGQQ